MSVDKKEHIMEAAIRLFANQGFEGTSIREIAAEADVNVAMINYYFGSKDKLFENIVEYKSTYIRSRIQDIAANVDLDELEKINQVIEAYVERLLNNRDYHRIIHQELLVANRDNTRNAILRMIQANRMHIKQIIEQGIKKKIFKKVDPVLTIASLIGTINQVLLSVSMCNSLFDEHKQVDPYTDTQFRKKLINHLKQMMHSHLLP